MSAVLAFFRSWISASSDHVWILIGVIVAMLAYGVFVGRDRMVTLLLATYLSLAVLTNAPIIAIASRSFGIHDHPTLRLGWFLGLFFLMSFLVWRSHILRGMAYERGAWWESSLLVVLQAGLMISIVLFLLPTPMLGALPPPLIQTFLGDAGRSFWLIAPLVFLAVLGRRAGDTFE